MGWRNLSATCGTADKREYIIIAVIDSSAIISFCFIPSLVRVRENDFFRSVRHFVIILVKTV